MNEPQWIPELAVLAIHEELIAEHGGTPGILNRGSISSTLSKPRNLYAYGGETATIYELAAAYGYGFAKNHCFVDGNKRVSLALIDVFLRMNGYCLTASEAAAAAFILDLCSQQELPEEGQSRLAEWIQNYSMVNDSEA